MPKATLRVKEGFHQKLYKRKGWVWPHGAKAYRWRELWAKMRPSWAVTSPYA